MKHNVVLEKLKRRPDPWIEFPIQNEPKYLKAFILMFHLEPNDLQTKLNLKIEPNLREYTKYIRNFLFFDVFLRPEIVLNQCFFTDKTLWLYLDQHLTLKNSFSDYFDQLSEGERNDFENVEDKENRIQVLRKFYTTVELRSSRLTIDQHLHHLKSLGLEKTMSVYLCISWMKRLSGYNLDRSFTAFLAKTIDSFSWNNHFSFGFCHGYIIFGKLEIHWTNKSYFSFSSFLENKFPDTRDFFILESETRPNEYDRIAKDIVFLNKNKMHHTYKRDKFRMNCQDIAIFLFNRDKEIVENRLFQSYMRSLRWVSFDGQQDKNAPIQYFPVLPGFEKKYRGSIVLEGVFTPEFNNYGYFKQKIVRFRNDGDVRKFMEMLEKGSEEYKFVEGFMYSNVLCRLKGNPVIRHNSKLMRLEKCIDKFIF